MAKVSVKKTKQKGKPDIREMEVEKRTGTTRRRKAAVARRATRPARRRACVKAARRGK